MSMESDTSNSIQATTFVTTRDPDKPPTPGPEETKNPDDKPPTPGPDDQKEEKEAKTPDETKDPDDKPPTPGPQETKDPDDKPPTPGPEETKNPDDKPPTPEPDTTRYLNTTINPSKYPNGNDYDSTLAPWSTLFEEDRPTSYPTSKPPKEPKETKDPDDKPPTPGPDDDPPPPRPSDQWPWNPDESKDGDRPPTPDPDETKLPKGGDGAAGHAADTAADLLPYKQSLGVSSVVIIIVLIIFAFLQIIIHKNKGCYKNFKKGQLSSYAGKTLFILFVISTVMFLLNAITFCYFILHFNTLIESEYEMEYTITNIMSFVPYRLGKLGMSLFFIFRLHFVFKEASLRIGKVTLYSLIILSIIGTILGCTAAITGPLKVLGPIQMGQKEVNANLFISTIALAITILVDIIVMYLYNQRLRAIVIMQGEVSRKSVSYRRATLRSRANTASTYAASMASRFGKSGGFKSITKLSTNRSTEVELSPDLKSKKSSTWTRDNSLRVDVNNTDNEGRNWNRIKSNSTHLKVAPMTPTTPTTPAFKDFPTDGDGDNSTEFPRDMSLEMNGDGDGEWDDDDMDRDTPEDDDEDEMVEVTETQVQIDRNLVRTITKSTLLSLIGIMTSFWLHVEMIVMAIQDRSDGVMIRGLASFDGGINVICMYLVFAFAKPYYDVGCKVCHWGLSKCCKSAARRAVIRAKSTTSTELSAV